MNHKYSWACMCDSSFDIEHENAPKPTTSCNAGMPATQMICRNNNQTTLAERLTKLLVVDMQGKCDALLPLTDRHNACAAEEAYRVGPPSYK